MYSTAKNTYSRCMFGIGYGLGAAGTVSSAFTAFNLSVGLSPVAVLCDIVTIPVNLTSKLTKITNNFFFKHKEKIYESGHSSRFWIV